MENLPENNDLFETAENAEESTIFSAPVAHSTKNQFKKKKHWMAIVSSVLAVAVLVGSTFAVIKLIPKKTNGNSSNQNIFQPNSIKVLEKDAKQLKTVTIKNTNGEFTFYSETEKKDSTETVSWYLKGYGKDLTNSYTISVMVDTAALITASKEITEMSDSDCGLDKPEITLELVENNGETYKVLIGDTSYDKNNCYLKLNNTGKIYLSSIDIKDTLDFEALDLASTDDLPAFEVTDNMKDYLSGGNALASFDKITLSGKNFDKTIVIEPNNNDLFAKYQICPYIITAPTKRIANDETVPEVFSLFTNGLSVSGAYSFDVKNATLKKLGLDKPDFVATISVAGKTMTYKFALQQDGDYAVICDKSKLVSRVGTDTVPFAAYELSDFYSTFVSLFTVTTLDSFEIKIGDEIYKYNITATKSDDDTTEYTVSLNGKNIKWEDFTGFYETVATLPCSDFTTQSVSGTPDYTFTFNFNKENGGGKTVTKFYKVSDTRYQYSTDGINLGKVTSYSLKKVIESMSALIGE